MAAVLSFPAVSTDQSRADLIMSRLNALYDTLVAAHDEKKSGQIVIFGRRPDVNKTLSATIKIDQGEIVGTRFGRHCDITALREFLQMEISDALFMRATVHGNERSPDMPTMQQILEAVRQSIRRSPQPLPQTARTTRTTQTARTTQTTRTAQQPPRPVATPRPVVPTSKSSQFDLYDDVKRLLSNLYGASAEDKLRSIAAKFHPHEHPEPFLKHSKRLVEINYGKKLAEEMFANIQEKLNKNDL